ncbi:MAG: helix-turn-helix transcriptional regulator [Thermotogota bacterium]|nr:helix-turn-helix transcriptional regulator [Thermotogota bacterium]
MKNKNVSNLIKELRNKLGLTQEQFAQKVGVTFSTINNWEKGTRTPHPFLFQRLLEMAKEAGLKNIENIKRTKK